MCGRYRIKRFDLLVAGLRSQPLPGFEEFDEKPRWNVAPSQLVPIIRSGQNGTNELALVRWGLIPSWTKERPKLQPINARAETIATSGMFRQAFARRRCLIPADGFYEWKKMGKAKQPMFIHRRDDELFRFAGLWERWTPPGAEPVETMTIITTTPNPLMDLIHDRMPVILRPEDCDRWLNPKTSPADAQAMLKPCDPDELEAYPVSKLVNSPRNDDPSCCESSFVSVGPGRS
jgi:putative SOS response-associated peptidase YedK